MKECKSFNILFTMSCNMSSTPYTWISSNYIFSQRKYPNGIFFTFLLNLCLKGNYLCKVFHVSVRPFNFQCVASLLQASPKFPIFLYLYPYFNAFKLFSIFFFFSLDNKLSEASIPCIFLGGGDLFLVQCLRLWANTKDNYLMKKLKCKHSI